jgi:hypothetical protein
LQSQKPNLLHFVQTNEELKIVQAIDKSFSIKSLGKELYPLLQVVARWKMYLGISDKASIDDTSIQVSLVRDFIFENYSHLTLDEVELAYKLAATNKLHDCDYFGFFSPFYVGKVLDAYLYYRKREMADLIRRKEKEERMVEMQNSNKMTPDEECVLTKKIIEDFYNDKEVNDVMNLCWNYLRGQVLKGNRDFLSKWTSPQKEDYEEAMRFAKQKIMEKENLFLDYYKSVNRESDEKKIARNYCVKKYFEMTPLENILKSIKPEHFS